MPEVKVSKLLGMLYVVNKWSMTTKAKKRVLIPYTV